MPGSLRIVEEPRGRVYEGLVHLACELGSSFSLVWRDDLRFEPSAGKIADDLRGELLREERTDEWPGTKLMGRLATVRHYALNEHTLRILVRSPGLYGWLAPTLPEDLALYSGSGELWLGSIAHEKDSWLSGSHDLEATLASRLPGLVWVREP